MRPLALAARWGTDPQETLEVFLRATLAGLLELRWELLCPSCRGAKASAERRQMTLGQKARFYEAEIAKYIKRTPFGFVAEAGLRKPSDRTSPPGERTSP